MVQAPNIVGKRRLIGGLAFYVVGLILAPLALNSQFAAGDAALLWAVVGGIPLAIYIAWPLARKAIATPASAAESNVPKPVELTEIAELLTEAADRIARSTVINVLSRKRPLPEHGRAEELGRAQLEGLIAILSPEDRHELKHILSEAP